MPLTSSRMLAVIHAGLTFHNALENAQALVRQQCEAVRNGGDATQALEFLQTMISPETLVNFNSGDDPASSYAHSYFALKSEEQHFREFASSNARMRRYQARKRGARAGEQMPEAQIQMPRPKSPRQSDIVSSSADGYEDEDA